MTRSLSDRFFAKVEKTADCWLWKAALSRLGYGEFWSGGRMRPAHRIAYEMAKGPVRDDLTIDHLCRNRACVNPEHMELVTQGENTRRGESPWGINARKTHCVHGHELVEPNLYRSSRGSRICKVCTYQRQGIALPSNVRAFA